MKWEKKLKDWENEKPLTYPKRISKSFFWETSFLTEGLQEKYSQNFIESNYLNKLKQNHKSFNSHILKSKNKYALSFYNLSKKTLLIVPCPRKNKNFTTLKDFIDNASITHQKKFWKYVSKKIKKELKKHKKLWISTHGTGVPFLHVRIENYPKYYQTKKYL